MNKTETKKSTEIKKSKKVLNGVVISDKMKDTCTVSITRFVKHKIYKKYYKVSKKFKVHDVGNTKKVGDKVLIMECRPISKDKHFIIVG